MYFCLRCLPYKFEHVFRFCTDPKPLSFNRAQSSNWNTQKSTWHNCINPEMLRWNTFRYPPWWWNDWKRAKCTPLCRNSFDKWPRGRTVINNSHQLWYQVDFYWYRYHKYLLLLVLMIRPCRRWQFRSNSRIVAILSILYREAPNSLEGGGWNGRGCLSRDHNLGFLKILKRFYYYFIIYLTQLSI